MTSQSDGQEKAWIEERGWEAGSFFALEELVKSWFLECVFMLLSLTSETKRAQSGTLAGQQVFSR